MLVSPDATFISPSIPRNSAPTPASSPPKRAPETKRDAPHYQHSEIGYNYLLSNMLAAPKGHPGRGQLRVLEERIQARRRIFDYYEETLGPLPGIRFMPEAFWGRHTRWITCITVDPMEFGPRARRGRRCISSPSLRIVNALVARSPRNCLPTGSVCPPVTAMSLVELSSLTDRELARVVAVVQRVHQAAGS